MISHFTLGSNDFKGAIGFYDALMPTIGQHRFGDPGDGYVGYRKEGQRLPFVALLRKPFNRLPATCGNGFHIAWVAESADAVRAFHAAALANGGSDEGRPGYRPVYAADYFAAYVRDPAGNKLQAVCYEQGRSQGAGGEVVSHVTLPFVDVEGGRAFYETLLGVLGVTRLRAEALPGESYAFTRDAAVLPCVYVQKTFDGNPPLPGNGQHTAFVAESNAQVDAFHATAMRLGATDEGTPGARPRYGMPYYAAYVRDPSGTKIQAVCRSGI